jgi:peptide/nickel transport system substrate-binding protein
MKKNRPNQRLLIVLSLLIFCGVSCIPDKTNEDPSTTVNYKRTNNEVKAVLDREPGSLNPIISTSAIDRQIFEHLFSYLMVPDPQTLEYIPQLAKAKPEVKETTEGPFAGGVHFIFDIHDEAKWDDGTPVTGNDYIFTLKAVINPGVNAPRILPYVEFIGDAQVDPNNPKRIIVYTKEKYFLAEEAVVYAFPVLPAHIYDADNVLSNYSLSDLLDGDKAQSLFDSDEALQQFADTFTKDFNREPSKISGSGPYRLVSWDDNQRIRLAKKENYWGNNLASDYSALTAYPDELVFEIVLDAAGTTSLLKSEEVDVVSNFNATQFADFENDEAFKETYELHEPSSLVHYFLYLNGCIPKLQDKRVRRALAHLVDIETLTDVIFNGNGTRLSGPVHPDAEFYNKDLPVIPYSPEEAQKIFAEAGWEDSNGNGIVDKEMDGELVEMRINYLMRAGNERSRNIGELLIQSMKAGGVEVVLEPIETSLILDRVKRKDYEMSTGGRGFAVPLWDPKQNWHTEGDNRMCFGDARSDEIIDEIRVTFDTEKRNELYKELQAIIYEEQPLIFLFILNNLMITHKRFDMETTGITPGYKPNRFKLNI